MFLLFQLQMQLYLFFEVRIELSPMFYFFFNDTATTEIYTLSLHDALPIASSRCRSSSCPRARPRPRAPSRSRSRGRDRKSTRLNSSHPSISYAVFCLKKKKPEKYLNTPYIKKKAYLIK